MNIASVVTKKVSGEHVTGLMVKSKGLSFLSHARWSGPEHTSLMIDKINL